MVAEISSSQMCQLFSHTFRGINITKQLYFLWLCHSLNDPCRFNVISIVKCKRHYRSCVLRLTVENIINSEFSLHLGKFYMFRIHVVYSPCSKLPLSDMHVFVLCCTTQIMRTYNFDSCKSFTTWCVLINNNFNVND